MAKDQNKELLKNLITDYKAYIAKSKMQDEVYKWKLVNEFKGHPDTKVEDFRAEIHSIKFQNLIYAMALAVTRHIAKDRPEEYRQCFIHLFDESRLLSERLEQFNRESLEVYRSLGETLGHHQDERTMAAYLTFHNPDKYTFYKSSFYKPLCELMGAKPAGKFQKYGHYLQLLETFIREYIETDTAFIEEVKSYIPEFYDGSNHLLLAQDILFTMLDRDRNDSDCNYWIFQGNPKIYNIVASLNDNALKSWSVKSHKEAIKPGDKVILWVTGNETGCYGLAEVKSEVIQEKDDEAELSYYINPVKNEVSNRIKIEVTHNFANLPILKNEIESLPGFEDFKGGNQGTNFTATKEQYERMLLLRSDKNTIDQFKNNANMKLPLNQILYGPPGTGKTYSTIDKVIEICEPALFAVNDHKQNKELYDQLLKEGRVVFTTFHQSMSYEDFIEGIKPLKPGDEDAFLKYDVEPGLFKQIANTAKNLKTITSTNINWDNIDYYKMSIGGKNRPDIHNWCIENNVVGLSWGGEEDLSELVSKTSGQGWKKYRDDFKEMFPITVEKNRYHIQASYILNKMKLGDIVVISKGNHVIDAIGKIVGEYYFDDQTPTDMFHFRKVEWIATDLDASPEKFIDKQISQQSIYEFYDLDVKKEAFKGLTAIETTEEKPYVLVIDEINRGNVSAIFGELITLIEQDKRLGQDNELKVTLPYSKDKFGVPSNLYILGTMNTADRSIEALDTALRRRFSFVEMMPNPDLLKDKTVLGINLKELLSKINQRIEALIDRDHTIGHAYLIDVENENDLKLAFKDKIIPLLQEYFFGDYGKIGLVLGNGFVKKGEIKDSIFSEFEYEGREGLFQTTYELIPFDKVKFEEALKTLMK